MKGVGFAGPLNGGVDAQALATEVEDVALLVVIEGRVHGVGALIYLVVGQQHVELRTQAGVVGRVELDRQHRSGLALQPTQMRPQRRVLHAELEQVAVHDLDRRGAVAVDERHRLQRAYQRVEVQHRAPAHHLGIARSDLVGARLHDPPHRAVGLALDAARSKLRLQRRALERAAFGDAAVREHDRHRQHLVESHAVLDRAGSGGVVGHHAADRGAVGGGDVGRELQPEQSEARVQVGTDDARCTRAVRASRSTARISRMCLEKSSTTASATV